MPELLRRLENTMLASLNVAVQSWSVGPVRRMEAVSKARADVAQTAREAFASLDSHIWAREGLNSVLAPRRTFRDSSYATSEVRMYET